MRTTCNNNPQRDGNPQGENIPRRNNNAQCDSNQQCGSYSGSESARASTSAVLIVSDVERLSESVAFLVHREPIFNKEAHEMRKHLRSGLGIGIS